MYWIIYVVFLGTGTGCRGTYVLAAKQSSFDRVQQTVPDAMHTIAVQMKHLVKCIGGKEPEDSISVRKAEQELDRFKDSWINETSNATSSRCKKKAKTTVALPAAPFCLSKKDICEADRRAEDIITPAGDPFKARAIFTNISKLNSHQWKEVSIE